MFALLKKRRERAAAVAKLYCSIVEQSRKPVFYELYDVPDTATGRFDLICLHVFLVMQRFHEEGKSGKVLAQVLFDRMFRNMDRNLREMGVGDLGVPKHMKRMMKGFNGRAASYSAAIRGDDSSVLVDVLRRNLYSDVDIQDNIVNFMAVYVRENMTCLGAQSWDYLIKGAVEFKMMRDEDDRECSAGMVA